MPLFQEPEDWPLKDSIWPGSEPSKLTGGSGLQSPEQREYYLNKQEQVMDGMTMDEVPDEKDSNSTTSQQCTDRAELMERIKRGESPNWVPSEALQQEYLKENGVPIHRRGVIAEGPVSKVLPVAEIQAVGTAQAQPQPQPSIDIERTPSALHAGDFTEDSRSSPFMAGTRNPHNGSESYASASASRHLFPASPSLGPYEDAAPWAVHHAPETTPCRHRSPSGSFFASNYVLRKPTTPLVQQENNTDLDVSAKNRSVSPNKGNRRHTLPPHTLTDWQFPSAGATNLANPTNNLARSYRRDIPFLHSHQALRSITSPWSLQQPASPPTPAFLKSRRTSFSSEASARQRASMVGSYEESILSGRMSTAPSKPFDFHAHIGVLGRGKRPKMPPHITVPFQAVFYDWSSNIQKSTICDEPSPYVGDINLETWEQTLLNTDTNEGQQGPTAKDAPVEVKRLEENGHPTGETRRPKKRKRKDSSYSPAGSYRVPEQGQIQVVVKNSYKTALKLFLVPYDLTGMEPGQKTFIRQRYYSAGPILERPVASEANASSVPQNERKKPTLRYLIHLKICCPAKGRFFVYGNVRVVFANRVPDDKEHLSKEVQEPNPKYSLWKPNSDSSRTWTPAMKHAAEVGFGRRSSGSMFPQIASDTHRSPPSAGASYPYADADAPPVPPIPFHLPPATHFMMDSGTQRNREGTDSEQSRPTTTSSNGHAVGSDEERVKAGHISSDSGESDVYVKLKKGDAGYGGFLSRGDTPEPGDGLLARRLKALDTQDQPESNARDGLLSDYLET